MLGILRAFLVSLAMVLAAWAAAEALAQVGPENNPVWIVLGLLALGAFGVTAFQFAQVVSNKDDRFGGTD